MKVTLAVIADYASVSIGDKLNVLGVFDTIFAPEFPVLHPHMVFALRVEFDYDDAKRRHSMSIWLEDEDGGRLLETGGDIDIGPIPPGEFRFHNLIVDLNNVGFAGPATYHFVATIGGLKVDTPFRVVERR